MLGFQCVEMHGNEGLSEGSPNSIHVASAMNFLRFAIPSVTEGPRCENVYLRPVRGTTEGARSPMKSPIPGRLNARNGKRTAQIHRSYADTGCHQTR